MEYEYIILGGNISALITAKELANTGHKVALIAPKQSIGGHFSEFDAFGFKFDLGMVLLEFDSYRPQITDLSSYDPKILGSVGSFSETVRTYISNIIDYKCLDSIFVAKNGKFLADYFISNNLCDIKNAFNNSELEKASQQLTKSTITTNCHPKNKSNNNDFQNLNYSDCSISNHGSFLHNELFNHLVNKVTNFTSQQLSAKFHRLFWAPLFYPETLNKAFQGQELNFPPTQFYYPANGNIATFTNAIFEDINDSENISIFPSVDTLSKVDNKWLINANISSNNLISTLPQNIISSLLNINHKDLEKSSYALVFLEINATLNFNILFNADENFNFFRIINNSRMMEIKLTNNYIIIEYNYDYVINKDINFFKNKEYLSEVITFLGTYGVSSDSKILQDKVVYLKERLTFPTIENVQKSNFNSKKLENIENLTLMGASLGFGASSMNDQIIQALRYVSMENV